MTLLCLLYIVMQRNIWAFAGNMKILRTGPGLLACPIAGNLTIRPVNVGEATRVETQLYSYCIILARDGTEEYDLR